MSEIEPENDELLSVYVNLRGGIIVKKGGDYMEFLPYEAKELEEKLLIAFAEIKGNL